MKTKKQVIEREVFVFAEAKTQYELDNLRSDELPFKYIVKAYDYGDETCIRIMEQPVLITIPDGIDITLECIKNLEEKITAIQEEADKDIKDLRERIRSLALIEYQPSESTDDTP